MEESTEGKREREGDAQPSRRIKHELEGGVVEGVGVEEDEGEDDDVRLGLSGERVGDGDEVGLGSKLREPVTRREGGAGKLDEMLMLAEMAAEELEAGEKVGLLEEVGEIDKERLKDKVSDGEERGAEGKDTL